MNVAEIFIRRPVMTTLVMLAFLLFGALAYRELPVSDLPNVDFPTISVNANLPGASPETMAASVATPLEKQFTTIAGLDSMTSSSSLGGTSITLQFTLDRNIDAAAQDVQSAISRTLGQLPRDMPTPPTFRKVNPADSPILFMALSSQTLPLSQVNEYADTFVAQRISMVSGVAQVQIYGGQKYAVRVQLDPRELATRSIGLDEVTTAIQRNNVNLPTGTLWGRHQAFTVEAEGQLTNAAAYRPIIVTYRNGNPVRLEQLGRVLDSVENDKTAAWYRDERSVMLAVQRQPGTNTVEVVDNIKTLLQQIRTQLPASVALNLMSDRSTTIRESVNDVQFTLLLALALVVLVIFLFLRNLSATAIPSMALPFSIVGTFAVMYLLGYSLDNLSLMALTLSVGFVVDDAIVMLENIVRHMEHGEPALQAALLGSREVGFTILSMTISLVAVFVPVLFMGGLLGRLLHEFAVTISAAILVSGIVSLSLTPMLCSRFLKPPAEERHGKLYRASERFFEGMLGLYDRTLQVVLRHRFATMAFALVILVATCYLFVIIPKGFLPSDDTDQVSAFTEAAQGISFESMVEHQKQVAAVMLKEPDIRGFMSGAGAGGPNSSGNQGRLFVYLKPRKERKKSADELIEEWRPKLSHIPGIQAFLSNPPPIRIGGQQTRALYQYTLQGPDTAELYEAVPKLEARLREAPELMDINTDLQIKNPQVSVEIDRDRAATLGVSPQQVEEALYTSYGQRQISSIYAPTDTYRVILELDPRYQRDQAAMSMLYVRSSTGALVPLDAVVRTKQSTGPLQVNHLGQLPAATLSFNLKPGVALSQAVSAVQRASRETLPDTITGSFQGTAQAFESSVRGLGILLVLAILVIYIVLGILYESFIHPITILSGLPSAGFGALVTLMLFRMDLNIYGFVGVILLVGIVKKNAIMMIDFALDGQRRLGLPPAEAIYQGCLVRFRPIMMTTMAALMGTLPIALGIGAGAESRRPLGLAVVGGLIFSQAVTLYLTPVFYLYMESFQNWLRRPRKTAEVEEMPLERVG